MREERDKLFKYLDIINHIIDDYPNFEDSLEECRSFLEERTLYLTQQIVNNK